MAKRKARNTKERTEGEREKHPPLDSPASEQGPNERGKKPENGEAAHGGEETTPQDSKAKANGSFDEVRSIVREELQSATKKLIEHADLTAERAWYTTAQFGAIVGRVEWTVRKHCRNGRLNGVKVGGRGVHGEWRLSHEELLRFQREGYED
jgi:hypothetical protein